MIEQVDDAFDFIKWPAVDPKGHRFRALLHERARSTAEVLSALRETSRGDTSLVLVTSPPLPGEVAALVRVGNAFGRKLAVFVYPVDPASVPPDAAAANAALAAAG